METCIIWFISLMCKLKGRTRMWLRTHCTRLAPAVIQPVGSEGQIIHCLADREQMVSNSLGRQQPLLGNTAMLCVKALGSAFMSMAEPPCPAPVICLCEYCRRFTEVKPELVYHLKPVEITLHLHWPCPTRPPASNALVLFYDYHLRDFFQSTTQAYPC